MPVPPPPPPSKASASKRRPITTTQRLALRRYAQRYPRINQTNLATWFEQQFGHRPSQGTISESLSKRFIHLDTAPSAIASSARTKQRPSQWPVLEAALFEWHQRFEHNIPISGDLIKEVATRFFRRLEVYKDMELPLFSNGWLDKFKGRHGIKQRSRHGEAGSVDESLYTEQLLAIQAIASQYHPSNIYNCDETGLFWKATPERGLSTQQISGTTQDKARITLHFCCNADGSDKLPLWIIGSAMNPRCFGHGGTSLHGHDCFWRSNKKAWMNTQIMVEWLQWFDRRIAAQNSQRKVLLIMDNFSAHAAAVEALSLTGQPLQQTIICWLPPNTTSQYQPLDQGIIKAFKAHYRRRWLFYMCEEFEALRNPLKTINVLKAISWSIQAWQAVKASTIANCWYHSTLLSRPLDTPQIQDHTEELVTEASALIQRLQRQRNVQNVMSIASFLNPVEEDVFDHPTDDLIQQVAEIYDVVEEDSEADEEVVELLPRVSIKAAIEALQTLRLFEQQQEEVQKDIIEQLNLRETSLYQKRYTERQQASITSFGSGSGNSYSV